MKSSPSKIGLLIWSIAEADDLMEECTFIENLFSLYIYKNMYRLIRETMAQNEKSNSYISLTYWGQMVCIEVEDWVGYHLPRALSILAWFLTPTVTTLIITSIRGKTIDEHWSSPFTRLVAEVDGLLVTFKYLGAPALFLFCDQLKI